MVTIISLNNWVELGLPQNTVNIVVCNQGRATLYMKQTCHFEGELVCVRPWL